MPDHASAAMRSACDLVNGLASAVPCTSTKRPAGHDEVHVDLGACCPPRSRGRGSARRPTIPALTAATHRERDRATAPALAGAVRSASASATQAPVIDAVRVPPSAWSTSQSIHSVRSPSAARSVTARRLRPIRRWISCVRPPTGRARLRARCACSCERGSMPYSAVTQPRPLSAEERRDALLDRRGADDARGAHLDQHRTLGRA